MGLLRHNLKNWSKGSYTRRFNKANYLRKRTEKLYKKITPTSAKLKKLLNELSKEKIKLQSELHHVGLDIKKQEKEIAHARQQGELNPSYISQYDKTDRLRQIGLSDKDKLEQKLNLLISFNTLLTELEMSTNALMERITTLSDIFLARKSQLAKRKQLKKEIKANKKDPFLREKLRNLEETELGTLKSMRHRMKELESAYITFTQRLTMFERNNFNPVIQKQLKAESKDTFKLINKFFKSIRPFRRNLRSNLYKITQHRFNSFKHL